MRVDPIELEPLYHFHPGARVFRPAVLTPGSSLVVEARRRGAQCVSLPADPGAHVANVLDAARDCRATGLLAIGGITSRGVADGRGVDLCALDAATVDLTNARDASDLRGTLGKLRSVLDRATTWLELVVRVIPGQTGRDRFIDETSKAIGGVLGPDVPVHFGGLAGEAEALRQARWIAISNGLHWVYMDSAVDARGRDSWCPGCDAQLVARTDLSSPRPDLARGTCRSCGWPVPGRFGAKPPSPQPALG